MLNFTAETRLQLKNKKNLLAFSAGVDSSALFFLLLRNNISFDIALVNYGIREESKEEELYARKLAKEYQIKAHITPAPSFESNFEKNARDFRYDFFDKLMNNYNNLLTAHQLNDQMEWFLMRLTKGAGIFEIIGLKEISKRNNYTIVRPLLQISKRELLIYLEQNNHTYFIDKSNDSDHYERNRFRKNFSNQLIEEYQEGITRSFQYLKEDKRTLEEGTKEIFHHKEFFILSFIHNYQIVRLIDNYLKKLGYLLSSAQREELKRKNSMVFGGVWAVEIQENSIFIAPYKTTPMPKKFKEQCRISKIPQKVRAYLFEEKIELIRLPLSS